jgi:TatA/E family protein of Tat protein translocase
VPAPATVNILHARPIDGCYAGRPVPFQLGLPEIILVLVIALVFLGPKRLPEAGQALGKGMREFRSGLDGLNGRVDQVERPAPERPAYTPPPAYAPPAGGEPTVYTPPSPAPPGAAGTRQTESQ